VFSAGDKVEENGREGMMGKLRYRANRQQMANQPGADISAANSHA
jgi:hypothetical protein